MNDEDSAGTSVLLVLGGWLIAAAIGIFASFFAWGFFSGLAILFGYVIYIRLDMLVVYPWFNRHKRTLLIRIDNWIVLLWGAFFTYTIFQAIHRKVLGQRLDIWLGLSCAAAFAFWFYLSGNKRKTAK